MDGNIYIDIKVFCRQKQNMGFAFFFHREQQQQQNRMKNETIGELEAKLKQLKQDYSDDNARWQERVGPWLLLGS